MGRTSKINWIKIDPLLGTRTDASIARASHYVISTIWARRRFLGIPKFILSKNGIVWADQPLGRKPDNQIALSLGVSREAVRLQRKALSIPPFNPPRRMRGERRSS